MSSRTVQRWRPWGSNPNGDPTLIINDEKWNEIVAETKAGIERWNAMGAKYGKADSFEVRTYET